ncbi:MAG: peptidoglycan editing factor PgeF [Bacteroidales bacterium]|nr:peptidoglycan editing factor PgeF [Bacteroidales bacterium]
MISLTPDNTLWGYKLLHSEANITHFVTHRQGGYSTQSGYESFNLSPYSGDDHKSVQQNKDLLFKSLNKRIEWFIQPIQTHQDIVRVIDDDFLRLSPQKQKEQLYGVDALITNIPYCCITVATADCVPVIIYDVVNQVAAVVHSGWRGTLLRIVEKSIKQMNLHYNTDSKDLKVCLGPSISLDAFEVGSEVYNAFKNERFDVDSFSYKKPETGKYHIDLWKCIEQSLEKIGVSKKQIEISNVCTYKNHKDFFSARRLGIKSGRTISGLLLNE